jgi:hypothetical protein
MPTDHRIDAHEVIIGIEIQGISKAFKLKQLRELGTIQDRIDGEEIQLEYRVEGDQVIAQTSKGLPVYYERQWWLGWSEFHPGSVIYSPNDE